MGREPGSRLFSVRRLPKDAAAVHWGIFGCPCFGQAILVFLDLPFQHLKIKSIRRGSVNPVDAPEFQVSPEDAEDLAGWRANPLLPQETSAEEVRSGEERK